MIIGSGLSDLGAFIYQQGYHYITNIDVSQIAVNFMKEKHHKMEEMDYVQMDITNDQTQIAADSFNCIIDKGTLDSIVCSDNEQRKVESMCANIFKFLSPGGTFICVSRGSPDTRLVYL